MRLDELPLLVAVCKVRREMMSNGEPPSSEKWTSTTDGRSELAARVVAQMTKDDEAIVNMFLRVRKGDKVNESGQSKFELLAELVETFGPTCFYANRGLGDCSSDVDVDRLLPGGRYDMSNCVIACSYHNRSRGDKPLIEYLDTNRSKRQDT